MFRKKIVFGLAQLMLVVNLFGCGGGGSSGGSPNNNNSPGISGGTLTLTNAPASTGGTFVSEKYGAGNVATDPMLVGWVEGGPPTSSVLHSEYLDVGFSSTGSSIYINFHSQDLNISNPSAPPVVLDWVCGTTQNCSGVTLDQTKGTVTFSGTVLTGVAPNTTSIILDGTLNFTPASVGVVVPPVVGGNSSSVLEGAVIGSSTEALGNLRKPLAVTVRASSDASLSVGEAFATRYSISSDYAYIAMPVTNNGTSTLCFVEMADLNYLDADGALILNGIAYVDGSVNKLSSGIYTNTCLAPGETGMMGDIKANLFAAVETMEFTLVTSAGGSAPAASEIPQSYTISSSSVDISVKNVGTGPSLDSGLATWYLLDDTMQPLFWGFATHSPTSSVIPISGTLTLTGAVIYTGSGSKLLVFTDFEDTTLAASAGLTASIFNSAAVVECSAALSTDELAMCKNESRNRRLEALKLSTQ